MGFRPDKDIQEGSCDPVSSPAVYIYDDTHINVSVSTYKQLEIAPVKKTDSFYEVSHGLGEYPGLVIMRALLETNGRTFRADGVGSSMNVFYRVDRFNNAYLVYGFNDENFRVWVDASPSGAIFDGRKHTWFDFMVSRNTVEIYAWKLSTLTPYVTHRFSMGDVNVPLDEKLSVKYELVETFIQVRGCHKK
ncbi:uncharacterized protein LOC128243303 [Mya arenaria]|uniref:uncharacterized protein LOC128243303 n=1 Tax=Mya arenaria TaxID=6604 RepID=UPI0022E964F2|nr:uncharacterized protein LOC128243303 [Mya arenaria]